MWGRTSAPARAGAPSALSSQGAECALLLGGRSSAGRAPPLQGGRQEFESPRLHSKAFRRIIRSPRRRTSAGGQRRSETASTGSFEHAHAHVLIARELERVSGAP